jgi:mono/diheme cytochrome c family protein
MMGMLLQKPVRVKREGSIMPAFTPDQLSDADLADIGVYLGSHYTPPAAPPALGVAANGAENYAKYCAMCHGANGEGVGKMMPVAFMAAEFKQHNLPPQLMLAFVNLACRSGSVKDMPVIGEDKLSDQDLADIAAYIWEMPVPAMPAGAPAPAH